MAFIGKSTNAGTGKASIPCKVTCSTKTGRLGVVFRNGLVAEGTPVDVLVGTEGDHGLLLVKLGTEAGANGIPAKSLGHKGQSTSWAGIRTKATKTLPEMKRRPCIIKEQGEGYILIDMQLDNAEVVDEGEGEEVAETEEVTEVLPAVDESEGTALELGL